MKKLATLIVALLLGASLSFAQAGGGSTDTKAPKADSGKKASKAHKGGKKSKKGAGTGTTTTNPK